MMNIIKYIKQIEMELLLKLAEININANIMMIKEIPMNYMPNIVI